jgi:hypothetical protein
MVVLMTSGRSLVLIVFALTGASGGLAGCVASSVPESIASVAARFIVDLGRADGFALKPPFSFSDDARTARRVVVLSMLN